MAAAGYENESNDEDPDPVVIEDTAKTVVIHKISSLKFISAEKIIAYFDQKRKKKPSERMAFFFVKR